MGDSKNFEICGMDSNLNDISSSDSGPSSLSSKNEASIHVEELNMTRTLSRVSTILSSPETLAALELSVQNCQIINSRTLKKHSRGSKYGIPSDFNQGLISECYDLIKIIEILINNSSRTKKYQINLMFETFALCSGNDIILTPNILSKDELCLQNMIYWNRSTQSPGHNLNSLTFSNEILDIAARIYSESDLKLYLYHMSIGKTYFEIFETMKIGGLFLEKNLVFGKLDEFDLNTNAIIHNHSICLVAKNEAKIIDLIQSLQSIIEILNSYMKSDKNLDEFIKIYKAIDSQNFNTDVAEICLQLIQNSISKTICAI